jgi:crossover junction endodeoxyribonuclease RuvC
MRALAIDPGFGRCGVAVLEKENGKERVIYSSCIETSAIHTFPERLRVVADECTTVMKKFKPDAVALEKLYFTSNQKTAMQVAEVRGAILYASALHNIPVSEYTPLQVKSAITGWGRADKKHVATMLHALVTIDKKIVHDDEYDAIAIGITHLAHAR